MRLGVRSLAMFVVVAAVPGCLDDSAPAAAPVDSASVAPSGGGMAPSAQVAGVSMKIIPIEYEGTARAALCVPTGPTSCGGPVLPVDGEANNPYGVGEAGFVTKVDVTLSWDAVLPTTQTLSLSLGRVGDGSFSGVATVHGESPLTMVLDDVDWGTEAGQPGFFVGVPSVPPVGLIANPPQDFAVSGQVSLLPALN